jgi:hypothetical protein
MKSKQSDLVTKGVAIQTDPALTIVKIGLIKEAQAQLLLMKPRRPQLKRSAPAEE